MSDAVASRADRSLFSLHENEDTWEYTRHRRQIEYLETNLRTECRDRFVGGHLGVSWTPGTFADPWVGPDVLVSQLPLDDPQPDIYLVREHGPIQFVVEVASPRTHRTERFAREPYYREDLQIPEYLSIDLDCHQLELLRLCEGAYQLAPEEDRRLHSRELDVWFGWDPDRQFVRIWTADGRMLPTWEELQEQHQGAERRATELAAELERIRRRTGEAPSDGPIGE